HIAKELAALYKAEYAREWRRLLQGVGLKPFDGFGEAVAGMNRLGDPATSPLRVLLEEVHRQTVWDDPGAAGASAGAAGGGFVACCDRVVVRRVPSRTGQLAGAVAGASAAPVGQALAGLARLLAPQDGSRALLDQYVEALGKVRSRFNAIGTQGDPGP